MINILGWTMECVVPTSKIQHWSTSGKGHENLQMKRCFYFYFNFCLCFCYVFFSFCGFFEHWVGNWCLCWIYFVYYWPQGRVVTLLETLEMTNLYQFVLMNNIWIAVVLKLLLGNFIMWIPLSFICDGISGIAEFSVIVTTVLHLQWTALNYSIELQKHFIPRLPSDLSFYFGERNHVWPLMEWRGCLFLTTRRSLIWDKRAVELYSILMTLVSWSAYKLNWLCVCVCHIIILPTPGRLPCEFSYRIVFSYFIRNFSCHPVKLEHESGKQILRD